MHIDVTLEEKDGYKWRFTGIYGEPKMEKKEETWIIKLILPPSGNTCHKNG